MEKKYIDASNSAEIISKKLNIPLFDLVDIFKEIPAADVVEVVRCRDCKRWKLDGNISIDMDGKEHKYGRCALTMMSYKENNFCSFGAKRDEGK